MQILNQRFHLLISKSIAFWIGARAGTAIKSNDSSSRGSKKGGSGYTKLVFTAGIDYEDAQ